MEDLYAPDFKERLKAVSYTHLDVYKRQLQDLRQQTSLTREDMRLQYMRERTALADLSLIHI